MEPLFILRSDPGIMRFIPRPLATSHADVLELIDRMQQGINENTSICWAITLKGEDRLIGFIGYVRTNPENHRAEVGYLLSADHQGKGIMKEALQTIIHYGFDTMKLHSIEGVVSPANKASSGVLLGCGFVKEAYYREKELVNGVFEDIEVYSLLKP